MNLTCKTSLMFQRYAIYRLLTHSIFQGECSGRNFQGKKKERRLTPPLRRSIGTPLMVDCRSSWAFPTSPGSQLSAAGLRSRDFCSRLSLLTLSCDISRPFDSAGSRLLHRRFPGLAPFPPDRSFQLALSGPPVVSSRSFFQPFDLPEPKPLLVFRSS